MSCLCTDSRRSAWGCHLARQSWHCYSRSPNSCPDLTAKKTDWTNWAHCASEVILDLLLNLLTVVRNFDSVPSIETQNFKSIVRRRPDYLKTDRNDYSESEGADT